MNSKNSSILKIQANNVQPQTQPNPTLTKNPHTPQYHPQKTGVKKTVSPPSKTKAIAAAAGLIQLSAPWKPMNS